MVELSGSYKNLYKKKKQFLIVLKNFMSLFLVFSFYLYVPKPIRYTLKKLKKIKVNNYLSSQ